MTRSDIRRRTISGPSDLRRTIYTCDVVTTEQLLNETSQKARTGPKNPDRYIEDRADRDSSR